MVLGVFWLHSCWQCLRVQLVSMTITLSLCECIVLLSPQHNVCSCFCCRPWGHDCIIAGPSLKSIESIGCGVGWDLSFVKCLQTSSARCHQAVVAVGLQWPHGWYQCITLLQPTWNSCNPLGRAGLYLLLCTGCARILEGIKGGNASLFQAGRFYI